MLMLVHGQIGKSLAATFAERLQRVGQDFAQQHLADQKLVAVMRVGARSRWWWGCARGCSRPSATLKREPETAPARR